EWLLRILAVLVPLMVDMLVFLWVFRFLAGVRPPRRDLLLGSLLAAIGSGVLRYLGTSAVGSVGDNPLLQSSAALATLLLWVNLIVRITLMAAAWIANPPARPVPDEEMITHEDETPNYVTLSRPGTLDWQHDPITGQVQAEEPPPPEPYWGGLIGWVRRKWSGARSARAAPLPSGCDLSLEAQLSPRSAARAASAPSTAGYREWMSQTFYAVIPAGGSGTRLWPLSRPAAPKFLHDLTGSGRTLIQQTVQRLQPLADGCLVVTGAAHADAVAEQVPELGEQHILIEPSPRESMAAIGLAAAVLLQRHPDEDVVLGSFAADHVITGSADFARAVRTGVALARQDYIATIGIRPTEAATAFGYIRLGPAV